MFDAYTMGVAFETLAIVYALVGPLLFAQSGPPILLNNRLKQIC